MSSIEKKPRARKATTTPRTRKKPAAAAPTPEQVAERAYLIWAAGSGGDALEHWLRAEQELATA